jgi:hypothetical protein
MPPKQRPLVSFFDSTGNMAAHSPSLPSGLLPPSFFEDVEETTAILHHASQPNGYVAAVQPSTLDGTVPAVNEFFNQARQQQLQHHALPQQSEKAKAHVLTGSYQSPSTPELIGGNGARVAPVSQVASHSFSSDSAVGSGSSDDQRLTPNVTTFFDAFKVPSASHAPPLPTPSSTNAKRVSSPNTLHASSEGAVPDASYDNSGMIFASPEIAALFANATPRVVDSSQAKKKSQPKQQAVSGRTHGPDERSRPTRSEGSGPSSKVVQSGNLVNAAVAKDKSFSAAVSSPNVSNAYYAGPSFSSSCPDPATLPKPVFFGDVQSPSAVASQHAVPETTTHEAAGSNVPIADSGIVSRQLQKKERGRREKQNTHSDIPLTHEHGHGPDDQQGPRMIAQGMIKLDSMRGLRTPFVAAATGTKRGRGGRAARSGAVARSSSAASTDADGYGLEAVEGTPLTAIDQGPEDEIAAHIMALLNKK